MGTEHCIQDVKKKTKRRPDTPILFSRATLYEHTFKFLAAIGCKEGAAPLKFWMKKGVESHFKWKAFQFSLSLYCICFKFCWNFILWFNCNKKNYFILLNFEYAINLSIEKPLVSMYVEEWIVPSLTVMFIHHKKNEKLNGNLRNGVFIEKKAINTELQCIFFNWNKNNYFIFFNFEYAINSST